MAACFLCWCFLLIVAVVNAQGGPVNVAVDSQGGPAIIDGGGGLTVANMNPSVVNARYAVRGALLKRAMELEKDGHGIIRCNIGNPQALGQSPISFARQVLSLVLNPSLADAVAAADRAGASVADKRRAAAARLLYPADAIARAQAYLSAVPSVGAYSDSQGVPLVRREVAAFIAARDGGIAATPDDVFLTDGASAGVKYWMQAAIRGPQDAILVPIPQYPLYSAVTTLFNGTLAPYYLDESAGWPVNKILAAQRKCLVVAQLWPGWSLSRNNAPLFFFFMAGRFTSRSSSARWPRRVPTAATSARWS